MKRSNASKYVIAAAAAVVLPASASELGAAVEADYPRLDALFQYFHANPELSEAETRTAARVADSLREAGYEVTADVGGTGVVGLLRNGAGRVLLVNEQQVPDGGSISTCMDITDRRRAEDALRASEESYRAIFNSVNDAIFIHRVDDGAIESVNRKMLEMYGYSHKSEILGKSIEDLSSGVPPYTLEGAAGGTAARGPS